VRTRRLVAVIVGPSGSGKSSVVFAGLLPKLQEDADWLIVQIRPRSSPFLSLASALAPLLDEAPSGTELLLESRKLATALQAGDLSLLSLVERILDQDQDAERFLLVIDQFEELFTITQDDEERRSFVEELLLAAEKNVALRTASFKLLLTLRADFMGQALAHRPFADALQEGSLMLGPMNRAELKTAIEKPAELQGAAFETGLVERLLDDVGDEPGNLPLLEFALTLLWERMDVGWMTHAIYDEIGQVDGALARYADEIYSGLEPQGQSEMRRAFIQLVQPGQGTEDTRRVATRTELVGVDWDLVQYLADKRLVVTGRNEANAETVEVVHEALIRGWGHLREWIDADRAFRIWQEGLRTNLRQWQATGQDEGALLRGAPLAQAEEWLADRAEDLSPAESSFIQASLDHSLVIQLRRDRRRRNILVALAVGLILALALSVFALSQRSEAVAESAARGTQQAIAEAESDARGTQQAIAEAESNARATQQAIAEIERARAETERARAEDAVDEIAARQALTEAQAREALARNLASSAYDNLNIDPQLGLLLALEAASQTYTRNGAVLPEAQAALHQAIQDVSRLSFTIPSQDAGLPYINFTADGSRLIARYFDSGTDHRNSPDGTTTLIWDAFTGELLHTLPKGVAVDTWPDTPFIGIVEPAEDEIILNLWNPIDATAQPPINLAIPESAAADESSAIMLSPDATRLVVVWLAGRVIQLWDLETVTQIYSQYVWDWAWFINITTEVGGEAFFKIGVPSYATISADGRRLYTLNPYLNIRSQFFSVWNVETAEPLLSYQVTARDLGNFNSGLSLSPDEKMYAIITDSYIEIRDFETSETLTILLASQNTYFNAISFNPDSTTLATATADGLIKIWDLANLVNDGSIEHIITLADPGISIHDMQFSPDGRWLATASADGAIKLWDIGPGGGMKLPFMGRDSAQDEDAAVSIALSPDGKRMAVADQNGISAIYDLDRAEMVVQLGDIQSGTVQQIDYSPDGATIATCRFAGPFQIWDAESGIELFRLDDLTEGACSFDYQSDGNTIILGFFRNGNGWHQELALPNLEPGILIEADPLRSYDWQAPHEGATISLAFDDRSSSLAVISGEGELFIWDTEAPMGGTVFNVQPSDSRALLVREARGYLEALLDPTHNYLVVTGIDGSVTILNPENPQISRLFNAHQGRITAVAFTPDGSQLATSGLDRAIRMWDIDTGDLLLSLTDQAATVTDLSFSPDGTRLYAAGEDGAIRPYVLDVDELIELAQSNVTRSLTDQECRQFLYVEACPEP
jgi:WD40 repeat protein